ncbi:MULTISPECIES: carboxylating nicotinate-nucleotide diphosphorylase [unclassified Lentimonas]|uniref:carboxylating nicotinate-nucleotide diphosphorylase n=1 Tax=unclassified Lentimonas TaxID=2630993 RepID=UPI00132893A5|nr:MULTISPECIES: carboxylating nicotinate-nucleotide diphosphorylase [unclassified Lentimonas]CAA6676385.1 Quinolinate phosphoribosyltransferase [decarboxylating] (EC [Lentimonas sp. CC4]CAA6685224.1 Quinolinate phosphoribosyltransferase [decarboxylating] (EC [Lentimonas sp. CC6]CAA7075051.1 Quinolinate phosphoribosyltransferase [decarboxylating] (EC [Lentimonas sp. CC4]CAA7169644.1 Quinolinate phosphoribosyltransferase [decarboxylating] (EC [Lentimonas sp. CC21]CAA7182075.1 Quinolinate phosph
MSTERRYTQTDFRTQLTWADLDPDYLRQLVGLAKIEDLAGAGLATRPERLGDVTTALMPEGTTGTAQLTAREPMVICGLGLVQLALDAYGEGCTFEAHVQDGGSLAAGDAIGKLSGPSGPLLQAERIILNFLQHLAGIATETRAYVDALGQSDTVLLDTRKTLPGYRVLQKYAFACGGGYNHRIGLFDRVMLKDNHLAVAGATGGDRLTQTVSLARGACEGLAIEVEVDTLEQIPPVLEAGADIILLDNFSEEALKAAIELIGDSACTEASGGIQIDTLPALGILGLDFISTGAPVHQSTWKDIGLDWL